MSSLLGTGVFNADGTLCILVIYRRVSNENTQVKCGSKFEVTFAANAYSGDLEPRFHRAMTRPFFTRERISDFEIYHRNCDVTLRVAKQRLNEGLSVDFQVTSTMLNPWFCYL